MALNDAGPDVPAVRTGLADLVAEAADGLSDRDRAVLGVGLSARPDGPELAEALGVSPASARMLTHRMRETIERCLGALLLARRARRHPDLSAILQGWDGQFTILIRKRVARRPDGGVAGVEPLRQTP